MKEILETLGFVLEAERKGEWERWRHKRSPDIPAFAMIIYPETHSQSYILGQASEMLIKVGAYLKVEQIMNHEM